MTIKVTSLTNNCKNVAKEEMVIAHLIGEELRRIGAIKYEHEPDMTDKVLRITGKFEVNRDKEVTDMKCPQCGSNFDGCQENGSRMIHTCACGCRVMTDTNVYKPMTEEQILHGVQQEYGTSYEMVVAIEELTELAKELCKDMRDQGDEDAIAEEMADVEIVLAHLKMIYKNAAAVAGWRQQKLRKLEQILRDA